ncbi:hypothetical protein PV328_000849 [Microctonus aethiopoides]|uniref:phospholipase A1 n=1 Tax=Microctonus aethiopoides TaxID=144406 RepID=A0AA39KWY8_9HYME|nr:hypothetical protein PV328_000849 [Microctonus aethiopoides]
MRQWEQHKRNSHRIKREASRVCYEDVGCFEDTGPFSYLEMLPSPPKDVGTSRKARSVPMEVAADDINEKASNAIDPDLPTKVIVHGFGSDCDHVWVYEMRSALMSVHDCNIVCVDWSPGSAIPNYVRAAANTRLVGRQLAKLVRNLNVSLDKVHMIGFSLGAHVAGFAGAELKNVSRITGLDPAGPLFESQDPQVRLDKTDANFVDVIHSNGEQLILGGLGSWQPMGDVDFYPNGGRMQTGCSNLFLGAVSDFIWSGTIEGRSLCNHRRAYKLFTDSVSPKCRFPAFPCEKGYDGLLQGDCFPCGPDRPCGDMGYYSDSSTARGQLYLVTREEEPFCAHQYQIKVFNSRSERPARSYGKLQVTLAGSGSFNETFTMTRKDDEELLVGAVLHKIVVPHPVIINLEAIEIKYTAYSGWISSGLVSWNIDKISILDSFGKSLSVCRRGLTLESGRPVYLPLYPGECNIPIELENSTLANTSSPSTMSTRKADLLMEKASSSAVDAKVDGSSSSSSSSNSGGIGPFTKEQNFERMDKIYSVEVFSNERNPSRNLGPFTKDQNIQMPLMDKSTLFDKRIGQKMINNINNDSNMKNNIKNINKESTNTWSFVDITESGSNSLENSEIESGRGFPGTGYIIPTSINPLMSVDATTAHEMTSEIHEPVLQVTKKETGRSLRLTEITEPILRPRTTRQNINENHSKDVNEKLMEKSFGNKEDTEKSFTVQFLPERLAGILAQAERYARQTFLPLISQYTPSFVGGRQERLKYFPSLTDISENGKDNNSENSFTNHSNINHHFKDNIELKNFTNRSNKQINFKNTSIIVVNSGTNKIRFESTRRPDDDLKSTKKISELIELKNDWMPMDKNVSTLKLVQLKNISTFGAFDNRDGKLINGTIINGDGIISKSNNEPLMKINIKGNDWIPIIDQSKEDKFNVGYITKDNRSDVNNNFTMNNLAAISTTTIEPVHFNNEKKIEKRFIPLVDFEHRDTYLTPTFSSNNHDSLSLITATSIENLSHIQKIPSRPVTVNKKLNDDKFIRKSTIFPYAYDRIHDPRSRYIPLNPENEMGKFTLSHDENH